MRLQHHYGWLSTSSFCLPPLCLPRIFGISVEILYFQQFSALSMACWLEQSYCHCRAKICFFCSFFIFVSFLLWKSALLVTHHIYLCFIDENLLKSIKAACGFWQKIFPEKLQVWWRFFLSSYDMDIRNIIKIYTHNQTIITVKRLL